MAQASTKSRWIARFIVLGVVVSIIWYLFGLHVTESYGPISISRAEWETGLTLPKEATNIRFASYSQWIAYGQYLRFEAPVDVCNKFAATILAGATTQPTDKYLLAEGARLTQPDTINDLSWFDLKSAKNVYTAGGGPSRPQIWVDQSRGVFYYRIID